ncbi:unnamed protein product [Protopolystoma xenopodis]|uniref:Uncharacterized protein n=1 Tax=Protopolystoma xenopodis TaxID=117903 RepID=A0A448WYD3_9PLAT|nr:unnamed protein product [Protopolystoma xenopodis]
MVGNYNRTPGDGGDYAEDEEEAIEKLDAGEEEVRRKQMAASKVPGRGYVNGEREAWGRRSAHRRGRNSSAILADLLMPRCRSVHFSTDVLVAHTGNGSEPILLSSAPLKDLSDNTSRPMVLSPSSRSCFECLCRFDLNAFSWIGD